MGLSARDVTVVYGRGTGDEHLALDGCSLDVERGEVVLVVGVTGSGKSTLLRVLAGLLEPDSGTVLLDGGALPRPPAQAVGLVFQNPERQLFGESVLEDVAFGPRMLGHPDPEASAAEALERVGLEPAVIGERSPFALSGGEARRVAIAGILALKTDFVLLDEPTVGLDRAGRCAVIDVVARERRERGVIVVTHHPDPFLPLADRVHALVSGRVVFSGTLDDVAARFSEYEAAGLALPELVRIQVEAVSRGYKVPPVRVTPESVAQALLASREGV